MIDRKLIGNSANRTETERHTGNGKWSRTPASYIVGYLDFPCSSLLYFRPRTIEEETYNMTKLIKSARLSHTERQSHDCTSKAPLRNLESLGLKSCQNALKIETPVQVFWKMVDYLSERAPSNDHSNSIFLKSTIEKSIFTTSHSRGMMKLSEEIMSYE
jgi:hypothetical protein